MDSIIASIKERRKILGWSQRDLAVKSSVPHSAVIRIERGLNNWPQYIEAINFTLDKELKSFKFKSLNVIQKKYSNNMLVGKLKSDKPNQAPKYYIDLDYVDLKTYFPNLSPGEKLRLFGKKENQIDKLYDKPKLTLTHKVFDENDRLNNAFEYSRELSESFVLRRRKLQKKGKYSPNFNPTACKWFELFDEVNNTKGLYATMGGEFYIEELGFFPDYFNPKLKLIMEWDESHHFVNGKLSDKDLRRQVAIQRLFPDFDFIRINELEFRDYL